MTRNGKRRIAMLMFIGILSFNVMCVYGEPETNIPAHSRWYNNVADGISYSKDYILADSDTRYYVKEELSSMTLQAVNYAKNEIYARHGRVFVSEELRDYFECTSWYYGRIQPNKFDENVFNVYEKANIKLLADIEKSKSMNGYNLDQPGYDYSQIMKLYWDYEYDNECFDELEDDYQCYWVEMPIEEMSIIDNQTNCSCLEHIGNTLSYDAYDSDSYGNYYEHSFHAAKGTVTFLNDYWYSYFCGTVATPKGIYKNSFEGYASLYVYGDGELIYSFEKMNNTKEPEDFCIDVSLYKQIQLQWVCGSDDLLTGIFVDWGDFATIFDGYFVA